MCKKLKINGVEKLVPNLFDKKKYIIHIRALDQALKHGLILECVVRKMITFKDYKNCLFSGKTSYRSQLMFRSSLHKIQTSEVNKIALSKDDNKRITIDGIKSLARGHL